MRTELFRRISFNSLSSVKGFVALVIVCLVIPCNVNGDITSPVISRTSGLNILFKMFGMPTFEHHSFTSFLDANDITKKLFQSFKNAVRQYVNI